MNSVMKIHAKKNDGTKLAVNAVKKKLKKRNWPLIKKYD